MIPESPNGQKQESTAPQFFLNKIIDGFQYQKPKAIKSAYISNHDQVAPALSNSEGLITTTSPDGILTLEVNPITQQLTFYHQRTQQKLQNLTLLTQSQFDRYCQQMNQLKQVDRCLFSLNSNVIIFIMKDWTIVALWCGHDDHGNVRMNTNHNQYPTNNPHNGIAYDESVGIKKSIPSPNGLFAAFQDQQNNWDIVQLLNYTDKKPEKIAVHVATDNLYFSPTESAYVCHDPQSNLYTIYRIDIPNSTVNTICTLPSCTDCFFTADGQQIVTQDQPDTALLWDIAEGTPIAQLIAADSENLPKQLNQELQTSTTRSWLISIRLPLTKRTQKK